MTMGKLWAMGTLGHASLWLHNPRSDVIATKSGGTFGRKAFAFDEVSPVLMVASAPDMMSPCASSASSFPESKGRNLWVDKNQAHCADPVKWDLTTAQHGTETGPERNKEDLNELDWAFW